MKCSQSVCTQAARCCSRLSRRRSAARSVVLRRSSAARRRRSIQSRRRRRQLVDPPVASDARHRRRDRRCTRREHERPGERGVDRGGQPHSSYDTTVYKTVTIEPCAEVLIADSKTVTVRGKLVAEGTATKRIHIGGKDAGKPYASIRSLAGSCASPTPRSTAAALEAEQRGLRRRHARFARRQPAAHAGEPVRRSRHALRLGEQRSRPPRRRGVHVGVDRARHQGRSRASDEHLRAKRRRHPRRRIHGQRARPDPPPDHVCERDRSTRRRRSTSAASLTSSAMPRATARCASTPRRQAERDAHHRAGRPMRFKKGGGLFVAYASSMDAAVGRSSRSGPPRSRSSSPRTRRRPPPETGSVSASVKCPPRRTRSTSHASSTRA